MHERIFYSPSHNFLSCSGCCSFVVLKFGKKKTTKSTCRFHGRVATCGKCRIKNILPDLN